MNNPRQLAFQALQNIYQRQTYTDIALDRVFSSASLSPFDRHLISELVYGIVRRKRTLDSLINQLATKKATQQPLNLRIILQLGLYQLRYPDKIPESAAVNTIADCDIDGNWFKVAVIPHTYAQTNLSQIQGRDWVNLESDILGKYVDRLISHRLGKKSIQEDISLDFLVQNGYY